MWKRTNDTIFAPHIEMDNPTDTSKTFEYNEWEDLYYDPETKEVYRMLKVCRTCEGRCGISGDWVPYGSTMAQLPDEICDDCLGTGLDLDANPEILEALKLEYSRGADDQRDGYRDTEWEKF